VHYDSWPLGHDKLDTTARYTRVATGMISRIKSPLDLLSESHRKTGRKPVKNSTKNSTTDEEDSPPA